MRRVRTTVVLLAAVLAVSLLAGCGEDDVPEGSAAVTVTGTVEITPPGEAARQLTNGTTVDEGTLVTVREGVASLDLGSGRQLDLRPGPPASSVLVGPVPELVAGDALLADGFPASVRLGDAVVSADGPTRVRAASPAGPASVTAYVGTATVRSADGVETQVAPLHTLIVDTGAQAPLRYQAVDAWDRRFLGSSVAFGDRLDALARGYTADLQPNTRRSVEFYTRVLPALADESEFSEELIDTEREAGEVLVGASLALAGTDGPFRDRWDRVFAFRDAGASWGLVALAEGVTTTSVLDTIELAVGVSPLSDDPRQTTTTTAPPPTSGAPQPTAPTTVPGPTTPPVTTPPTAPPTSPPSDEGGLLDDILTPVGAVLDELLELLGLG